MVKTPPLTKNSFKRRSSLCWICPKRSSVSAMYADVEPVPPSPRSKKRMSGVRVDKGHGAIKMLGAAAARVDRGHDAVQKQGPEEGAVTRSRDAAQKHWSEADELTLVNASLPWTSASAPAEWASG
jgi:hypothetical protein